MVNSINKNTALCKHRLFFTYQVKSYDENGKIWAHVDHRMFSDAFSDYQSDAFDRKHRPFWTYTKKSYFSESYNPISLMTTF